MRNQLLFVSLLSLTLAAFAQNTGHPGGGGPDTPTSDRDVACANLAEQADRLEEKFVKSWGKEYKTSQDFFKLMNHIIVENVIHTLGQLDTIGGKYRPNCIEDKKHIAEINLTSRPRYKEEVALLTQIQANWSEIKKEVSGSSVCSKAYVQRSEHAQGLEALIRLYEKPAP